MCGVVERAEVGRRGSKSRPERGCERITGEEIAGRARPGRALGSSPWLSLEDRGGNVDGSALSLCCSRVHRLQGPVLVWNCSLSPESCPKLLRGEEEARLVLISSLSSPG